MIKEFSFGELTTYYTSEFNQESGTEISITDLKSIVNVTQTSVTNTLTPYLLEVNKGPDMKYKDEKDKEMKTKVYLDVFEKSGLISVDDPNYINGFKEIPRYTRYLF